MFNFRRRSTRIRRNEFPDFEGQRDQIERMFHALPRVVGNIAVNFYKDRFIRQGWQDTRFERWEPRKRPDRDPSRRAVLVKTRKLHRSIRIIRLANKSVEVGTSVPYARIHNEGGEVRATQRIRPHVRKGHTRRTSKGKRVRVVPHAVAGHTRRVQFTIPQRQFIGPSQLLTRRIVMQINKALERAMKDR